MQPGSLAQATPKDSRQAPSVAAPVYLAPVTPSSGFTLLQTRQEPETEFACAQQREHRRAAGTHWCHSGAYGCGSSAKTSLQ